ncbi:MULTISPECIES: hypothetical protein [unclassified Kitasatospora]|uniref:hypothetical protein n=1 Tax=unclassified Kitasatospora TaxID=2633591 RepID=UPI003402EFDC
MPESASGGGGTVRGPTLHRLEADGLHELGQLFVEFAPLLGLRRGRIGPFVLLPPPARSTSATAEQLMTRPVRRRVTLEDRRV